MTKTLSTAEAEKLFTFENVGASLKELETPVPIIDFDIMLANLIRWQKHCDEIGIANWPHIKTHKLVPVAKLQMALGAKGLAVQKLGEAEVMAAAGLKELLLTFNVVGESKIARLAKLMRDTNIAVVADSMEVVAGLDEAGKRAGRKLDVLVECDTGMGRNGAQTPADALKLAQVIDRSEHLTFGGLMTYPPAGKRESVGTWLAEAKQALARADLPAKRISSGGTPDMWKKEGLTDVTEYRAGTYVYNDRAIVRSGAAAWKDCAETVLATVISTPTPERALIDAGSKALTSDLLGLEGYGLVHGLGDALVYGVNEEHGYINVAKSAAKPKVGDLVKVVMNHVCPVNNLFDKVVFVRGDKVLGAVTVDARGKVH